MAFIGMVEIGSCLEYGMFGHPAGIIWGIINIPLMLVAHWKGCALAIKDEDKSLLWTAVAAVRIMVSFIWLYLLGNDYPYMFCLFFGSMYFFFDLAFGKEAGTQHVRIRRK
jgi:hypothetical protein